MIRGQLLENNGIQYWFGAYTSLEGDAFIKDIGDTTQAFVSAVKASGKEKLPVLLDFTGSNLTSAVISKLKEEAEAITPVTTRIAAMGISGIQKVFANIIAMITGMDIRVFDTKEQALKWLLADQEVN